MLCKLEIEKLIVPFKKEILTRWKQRDPSVVPTFALNWEGPGISNGYGFGEWMAEKYFRNNGYYVINNEFDLFSKKSKYETYNKVIETVVSEVRFNRFQAMGRKLIQDGYKIENLDLFVYNTNTSFFVDAKKGKDVLREPQLRFMWLAKEYLEMECKIVYLSEVAENAIGEKLVMEVEVPERI